jgi:hypothetical protein
VSMGEITAASRALALNLGRAEQGSKAQTEALDRLGLSAQKLASIPLDQRIATINTALRENVNSTERAAVAAELFGARSALAIQALDAGTISEAARQVEIFGLNLSDVDAAKVEMANDAFSVFGLAIEGVGKQLTVELAPALKAVGDLFLQSAEEAGGMGNVVRSSVDTAITAISFLLDAADGVKRVFTITADALVLQFALIERAVISSVLGISLALNKIPGIDIDISGMSAALKTAMSVADQAGQGIMDSLEKPLAGQRFREFYDAAQVAAEEAAKVVVESRNAGDAITTMGNKSGEAAAKVAKLAKESNDLERAAQSNADVIAGLAEQIYQTTLTAEELAKRQAVLRLNEYATPEQIAAVQQLAGELERLGARDKAGASFEQVSTELGASGSGNSDIDALVMKYQERQNIINEALATEYINQQQHDQAMILLDQQTADARTQILADYTAAQQAQQLQSMAAIVSITQAQIGQMQGLFEEGTAIGKAFFVATQALAAANAIVQGFQSAMAIRVAYAQMAAMAGPAAPAVLATGEIHANVAQGMGFATAGMIAAQTVSSFDGGGYTGNGPRTGGIDGKGGFWAVMHPQETVTDHTKGQRLPGRSGGSVTNNFILQGRPDNRTQAQIAQSASSAQSRSTARLG